MKTNRPKGRPSKKILCFTLKMEFIREFDSMKEAAEFCNGYYNLISNVVDREHRSAYGYRWKWK
jgi:hypothetical protein